MPLQGVYYGMAGVPVCRRAFQKSDTSATIKTFFLASRCFFANTIKQIVYYDGGK
jgi:hypothetical protein